MKLFIFKPDTDKPHCCAAIADSNEKAIELMLNEYPDLDLDRIEFLISFDLSDQHQAESFVSLTEEWP